MAPAQLAAKRLVHGALHVWATNVDAVWAADEGVLHARCSSTLSEKELARAERIERPLAKRRWMAARAFLRTLLSAYTGERPRALQLAPDINGKPMLISAPGLRFNLSHSGPHAVCALTDSCAVGIDVQVVARTRHARAIARHAFGGHEAHRLSALPPAQRMRACARAWSAFEAERKRTGFGIARPSDRQSGPQPWLCQLEPRLLGLPSEAACAVALALAPTELRTGFFSDYWICSE